MPAAIAVPALIGAAGSLGSAYAQSRAAGKAMDSQAAGARQAVNAQNQGYQQSLGLYQNMLGGAAGTLGRLTGQSAGMQFAAPQGGPGQFSAPGMMPGAQTAPPAQTSIRDRNLPFGLGNARPQGLGAGMPQGSPIPQGNGGMIQLRAPDGSVGMVPSHLAEQFIQRGAQRVG